MFFLSDIKLSPQETSESPIFLLTFCQKQSTNRYREYKAAWQNKSFVEQLCFSKMMYLQKQVHTSPTELCRTVFRVPTCCWWGEINVEQANGRKAALIELDGLQSQKCLNKADIPRCASHVHIIKPAASAPRCQWTLHRQWELYGKVVRKALPPPL